MYGSPWGRPLGLSSQDSCRPSGDRSRNDHTLPIWAKHGIRQGGFWIGTQRKTMPYGTIPMGQMWVQYMIPAEKKHPYPVVMVHGGGRC